jgi:uncharacterized membrane protein YphA (DoxX/SURF4 family)
VLTSKSGGSKVFHREARYLLAAIQAIIGWEWITSGLNKVFSGSFPQSLSDTLTGGFKDNPNSWYIAFLQNIVLPHSVFYGYLIEWTEVIIGVVLLFGVFLLIGSPTALGKTSHKFSISLHMMVAIVAVIAAFLCINFHFWMGKSIIPGLGADPGDEGVDLDALMPPFSFIIMVANLYICSHLRNTTSRPEKPTEQGLQAETQIY